MNRGIEWMNGRIDVWMTMCMYEWMKGCMNALVDVLTIL